MSTKACRTQQRGRAVAWIACWVGLSAGVTAATSRDLPQGEWPAAVRQRIAQQDNKNRIIEIDQPPTGTKEEQRRGNGSATRESSSERPNQDSTTAAYEEILQEVRELERTSVQHGLTLATVIVAAASLLALIVFPASAWLSFSEARRFKREIHVLKGQLEQESEALARQVEQFRLASRSIEIKLRSIEHVRDRYYELILGLVQELEKSKIFGKKTSPDLRQRLYEAQARMDLRHPDTEEIARAIWKLRKQGGDSAIPDLDDIKSDPDADPELRLAAQEAIQEIQSRLSA